jgi:hypothetical protein
MFTGGIHYGGGSNHFTVHFFSECSIQCVVMPRNYIYLGVQFLLAKCMTEEASSEDCADQFFHFKCTSTHISHSWTLDTTYSLTQTLLPPPNPTLNSTSTTQNYRFAHCKTINCRRPGRGCLKKKWCIPLDLLRLSWLVIALLFPREGLTWRAPATTVVCRHDGNEFFLVGVNGEDYCPQSLHRSRK